MARSRSPKSSPSHSPTESPQSSPKQSLSNQILNVLKAIDRPAEFHASGQCLTIPLGLSVDQFGDIGLPLSAAEAKRLIKLCRQAPYGKGTETVVDTKVRKVWELDSDRVTIANPKWDMLLDLVLREIESKLGLPQKSLAAKFYKLLVYEKGSFFLPHRDGEKLDRMVATLVINLPSKHTGGELVIQHQGQQCTIAMSGAASGLETEYVAFYADCQHEVRPLQSGYRLCLTYNLALASPKNRVAAKPPDCEAATQQLEAIFRKWPSSNGGKPDRAGGDRNSPEKLAVILDHRYSEEGLSIDNLKGVDLAQANILFEAAERAGCDAHLALVTLWQTGAAEGGDYGGSYSRSRYPRWRLQDEEESTDDSASDYTMGEVYESSLTGNHWSDRKGRKVAFGKIPLEDGEIVSADEITNSDPNDEDFEGYTGNAGMTLQRWYHRAAVVIWPRDNRLRIWCDAGTDAALAGFQKLFSQLKKSTPDYEARLDECRSFARQIFATWGPLRSGSSRDPVARAAADQAKRNRDAFWMSLVKLSSPDLISEALQQAVPKDDRLEFPNRFLQWFDKHGWDAYQQLILQFFQQTKKETLRRNLTFFLQLATLPKATSERTKLCHELAPILVEAIERLESMRHGAWNVANIDRKDFIVDVAQALAAIGQESLLRRFLDWQFFHERYPLITVQIPAAAQLATQAKDIVKQSSAVQDWIRRIDESLQMQTQSAPKRPTNWQRPSKLSCTCADCVQLAEFLASPATAEARFPMAKQRRQHLHGIIERDRCDCTHETLRVGSPQVLVCKKTNGSYDRACQEYKRDLEHLDAIQKIIAKFSADPR